MPSPSRRLSPPHHLSDSSPSYRRQKSAHHRMGPPSRSGGGRSSPSRQGESRRSPEHVSSRSQPSSSSQRESRPVPTKRSTAPGLIDPNGRSYSASSSSKRKVSPKVERDIRPLDRVESSSSSRLPGPPRKMMRSSSPEIPPSREIPLLGHEILSPPTRGYTHSSSTVISTRRYAGTTEIVPIARSYTITNAPSSKARYSGDASPPPPQRYSNPSRVYEEPVVATKTTSSRGYLGSTTLRRSASEERPFERTSAQKRATAHPTSSRFKDMRETDDDTLLRSDHIDINPASLSGYVFNINNEPTPKYNRDQRNILRKIVNPEALQVVRRPVPRKGTINGDWDIEEEELYRPIARQAPSSRNGEGQRPIFERDEIVHQHRTVAEETHSRHRDRSPVTQVARYVSPEPYHDPLHSRNGQTASRSTAVTSRSTRAIPTRPSHTATSSRSAYYEEEPERDYHSRGYAHDEPRESYEHRESSRPVRREERDDLRHELEMKRVAPRHSPERARESSRRREGERIRETDRPRESRTGSEGDLRVQINEKRTHSTERSYERERRREHSRERPRERSRERRHSPSGYHRRHSDSYERRVRGHRESPPGRYHEERPKPWEVDPEFVPRGRAYFEHDNREEMQMMRGRGNMRMRPAGLMYRGRGIRRPYRGVPFAPPGFVMSHGAPRGYPPPRGFVPFGPPRPYAGIPIRRPFVPAARRPYAALPAKGVSVPTPSSTVTPSTAIASIAAPVPDAVKKHS